MAKVEKTAAFRQRRAADTARWRERLHRGAAVYPVEVDGTTFDLMERLGGLSSDKVDDKHAVRAALGPGAVVRRRDRGSRCVILPTDRLVAAVGVSFCRWRVSAGDDEACAGLAYDFETRVGLELGFQFLRASCQIVPDLPRLGI